jgi:hypothetical protein
MRPEREILRMAINGRENIRKRGKSRETRVRQRREETEEREERKEKKRR